MCCMGDEDTEEPRFKNYNEETLHTFSIEGFIEFLSKELKSVKDELNFHNEKASRIEKIIEKLSS